MNLHHFFFRIWKYTFPSKQISDRVNKKQFEDRMLIINTVWNLFSPAFFIHMISAKEKLKHTNEDVPHPQYRLVVKHQSRHLVLQSSLSRVDRQATSLLTDWSSQPTLLCRSNRTYSFLFFRSLYEVLRSARIFFFTGDGDLGLVRFCTSTLAVSVTMVMTSDPPVAAGGSAVSPSVSRSWVRRVRMLVHS